MAPRPKRPQQGVPSIAKKKVIVTETLTAEVLTEEDALVIGAAYPSPDPEAVEGTGGAGMGPGLAMGEGFMGAFHSAARAAGDAANAQIQAATLLGASTATGVANLYALALAAKKRRPRS